MSDYFRWSIGHDAPMFLELADTDGSGLTGATPKIAIRRHKNLNGSFLDNYYWDGSSSFTVTPTFLTMSEVDSTNTPGLYTYCFSQSLIQEERIYNAYFKHEDTPLGFTQETHYFAVTGSAGDVVVYESEPE